MRMVEMNMLQLIRMQMHQEVIWMGLFLVMVLEC